jgi:ribosome-associated heat shock protein Hsp15
MSDVRMDKWLWAARFYKTRSLAQEQLEKGRVQVRIGEQWLDCKPAREVHVGDVLRVTISSITREIKVQNLSVMRGPASAAQQLYEETPQSITQREKEAALRALAPMPGSDVRGHDGKGRPTKRDRRGIEKIKLKFTSGKFDW